MSYYIVYLSNKLIGIYVADSIYHAIELSKRSNKKLDTENNLSKWTAKKEYRKPKTKLSCQNKQNNRL